ncbi:YhcH/YjgK/YiaL family protein [Streptococcus catagoni]|uniref:YhcH/YjgK/YiaL family protein n=1 Tax=Streptococcus catagoni TaxID=2654874 RepID=UPI00140870FE|nr:YhcH/YjgK/YiaL family protein [Streptococcus catagoni]
MIIDKISRLSTYKSLHPHLDQAINYLMKRDPKTLADGKEEIWGQDVFSNYGGISPIKEPKASFEYHKAYADIHIVIEGRERILYGLEVDEKIEAYQESADIGLVSCQLSSVIDLIPGYFVLFFPNEYHQPGIQLNDITEIKKQVVKVRIN